MSDDPDFDPREALARWMIAPENPYFAKVIVNRVWAEIMGRGIVDPVDDLARPIRPAMGHCSTPWPTTSAATATTSNT